MRIKRQVSNGVVGKPRAVSSKVSTLDIFPPTDTMVNAHSPQHQKNMHWIPNLVTLTSCYRIDTLRCNFTLKWESARPNGISYDDAYQYLSHSQFPPAAPFRSPMAGEALAGGELRSKEGFAPILPSRSPACQSGATGGTILRT